MPADINALVYLVCQLALASMYRSFQASVANTCYTHAPQRYKTQNTHLKKELFKNCHMYLVTSYLCQE